MEGAISRDGSDIMSWPSGGAAVSGAAISSTAYNAFRADLLSDLNTPRPITMGGTGAATASAARTALGVQALDATLTALAALSTSADQYIYATGSDTFALATVTTFMRTVLDDTTASAARTTLGLAIGTDVQAYDADTAKIDVASTWTGAQAIPIAVSAETSGTLTSASRNATVNCAGGITLDDGVFTAGDYIMFEAGASNRTFTRASGLAMYVNGTDSASATLTANTLGSAYWRSASIVVLGGNFA